MRKRSTPKASSKSTSTAPPPDFPIVKAMSYIKKQASLVENSTMSQVAELRDPFRVLIGTILSLRTQDKTTMAASRRLFDLADSPETMLQLEEATIAEAIYPVGFYKTKAGTILEISRSLINEHNGEVPNDLDALCLLKGIGRKTANLTITLGFGAPGICVDTHVHRICNRWGYVATKTPDQTEMRLREILPKRYWIPINEWLVLFGQNTCGPISPICSSCGLANFCPRRDVKKSR